MSTISFDPQRTIESTVKPGVRFTVRHLNKGAKAKRELALLDTRTKLGRLWQKQRPLFDDKGAVLPGCEVDWARLDTEVGCIMAIELQPAFIRAGLESLEGYEIKGQPATVETLIASGEDDLIEEIYAACVAGSGLTDDQGKNLQLPGTSPVVADGAAKPTTAPDASV